jgi:hypothetical protein
MERGSRRAHRSGPRGRFHPLRPAGPPPGSGSGPSRVCRKDGWVDSPTSSSRGWRLSEICPSGLFSLLGGSDPMRIPVGAERLPPPVRMPTLPLWANSSQSSHQPSIRIPRPLAFPNDLEPI